MKRSTSWDVAFQRLWAACQISSHRAKLEVWRRSPLPAPLRSPPTFLAPTPSDHILFSLCCRLWFVESKAAGPPWRQQSKFNIRLWGGKRIALSACTQSLHWLVQKSTFYCTRPKNDQTLGVCVWLLNTECLILVQNTLWRWETSSTTELVPHLQKNDLGPRESWNSQIFFEKEKEN